MADTESDDRSGLQKLLDNTWLLLVLGLVVPILSYTVWGWIELLNLPDAKLP